MMDQVIMSSHQVVDFSHPPWGSLGPSSSSVPTHGWLVPRWAPDGPGLRKSSCRNHAIYVSWICMICVDMCHVSYVLIFVQVGCMLRDFVFAWLLPSGSNHVEQGWWYSISYFICLTWSIEPSNLAAVTAREKTSQWIMNLTLRKPWIMNVMNRSF